MSYEVTLPNAIADMIRESAKKLDGERESIRINSGWMVQFCPCGHSALMACTNPYVAEAKTSKHLDALCLSSQECPVCNKDVVDPALYARVYLDPREGR